MLISNLLATEIENIQKVYKYNEKQAGDYCQQVYENSKGIWLKRKNISSRYLNCLFLNFQITRIIPPRALQRRLSSASI